MIENNNNNDVKKLLEIFDELYNRGIFDIFNSRNQSDYKILNYLLTDDNTNPSIIAEKLNLTRANVAASLKILESKEYITRKININNRRQIFVSLTEQGRNYVTICNTQLELLVSGWFNLLSQNEIDELFKIAKKALKEDAISDEFKELTFGEQSK